jgi:SRSO17 transposase
VHPGYEIWLNRIFVPLSQHFVRSEPRQRAWTYLCQLRLTSDGDRLRRHIASYPLEQRADGGQRLLVTARWDEDRLRTESGRRALLYGGGSTGRLLVTEVAFPKKGTQPAGVARQFSMEGQRLENCQVGIFVFDQTESGGLFLIDCALYLPSAWLRHQDRRRKAGVPDDLAYRPKSAIVLDLVDRLIANGHPVTEVHTSLLCPDEPVMKAELWHRGIGHRTAAGALLERARTVRWEIGFDRYEVRSWRGWHRHMTLVTIAQNALELSRIHGVGQRRGVGHVIREPALPARRPV